MKKIVLFITITLLTITQLQAQGWGQTQKIVPDDRFIGQQFGASVDIDGNYAVAGILVSNSAKDAYVFENDGNGNWVQIQKLQSPNFNQFDHFGTTVAISGDYIFIGAWGQSYDEADSNYLQSAGAVYIFKKQASGLFDFEQKIVASDREALNAFGYGIALNGDYAVVSPVRHDFDIQPGANFLDDAGAAYIFERDGTGTWNEVQKIVASDRAAFDYFGQFALAVNGDYIAVGSYGEDEDENGVNTIPSAGSAYIFQRDGSGTWNETQKIVASDRESGDLFGCDVAISGNYIVVGAYGEDIPNTGDSKSGAAYIFEKNGDVWNETQKIIASNRYSGDQFGHSVSIDGNHIIIGAYLKNFTDGGTTYPGVGRAYVFENDVTNTWNEIQNMYSLDIAASDYFGYSVAISGGYAVVGAYQEDEDENNINFIQSAGSVYIFDANEPSTLSVVENNFSSIIKAYPNPVINNLNLKLGQNYNSVGITITNILGQNVFVKNYRNITSIELPLEIPKGMYLVEVRTDNLNTSVIKIIKE